LKFKLSTLALAAAAALAAYPALAQQARSGKEVVESTCVSCHGSGAKGAPRIGDRKAWRPRASQGISSLTQSAIKGIRNMPAHGGNAGLSDLELARGVAYMVNASGGKWTEPASEQDLKAERSGAQVVKLQCAKCHQDGKGGAPKVGDRAAWSKRLSQGVDHAVRSAVNGHGGMPPRGDRADLTDGEVRAAILYMLNAKPAAAGKASPPAK
jgi:cytochrome c5